MEIVKAMSKEKIEEGVARGQIEVEYEREWAKDEDGIARPVGWIPKKYTEKRTGKEVCELSYPLFR